MTAKLLYTFQAVTKNCTIFNKIIERKKLEASILIAALNQLIICRI